MDRRSEQLSGMVPLPGVGRTEQIDKSHGWGYRARSGAKVLVNLVWDDHEQQPLGVGPHPVLPYDSLEVGLVHIEDQVLSYACAHTNLSDRRSRLRPWMEPGIYGQAVSNTRMYRHPL